MPGISAQEITRRGRLLETGQRTVYAVGDDGDHEAGIGKVYYVLDAGAYGGTSDIEVAHLADNTLSFTAPNTIASAGNLLVGWAVNDLMVIKGTANNDGVVTVTGIGGAPANLTISAAVNEAAGAYMSLYKQTPHSNNCVFDRRTGRMWSRNTSNGEAVGVLSDGTLNWYAVATLFPLHPVAADLQMIGPPANVLRIVNAAAEIDRYHVGDLIKCGGFANPANNLPGYYVTDVQIWAALSLDVYLEPVNNVLVSEVAAGARTIGLVTRSIFNYAAGANLIGLGGYTDWRVPNVFEGASLLNHEAVDGYPDPVAFPGWGNWVTWTSTTRASQNTSAVIIDWLGPYIQAWAKTGTRLFILVRG